MTVFGVYGEIIVPSLSALIFLPGADDHYDIRYSFASVCCARNRWHPIFYENPFIHVLMLLSPRLQTSGADVLQVVGYAAPQKWRFTSRL
jgi:hypothetical protein